MGGDAGCEEGKLVSNGTRADIVPIRRSDMWHPSHHRADSLMTKTKKSQKASNSPPLIKLSEVDQFSKVVVRKLVLFEVPQADHVVS